MRRAFTMIELAVTLVIVGIVSVLGIAGYSYFLTSSQNSYGPQVLSSVSLGLRNMSTANNFMIPAYWINQQADLTIAGVPISRSPVSAPTSVSGPDSYEVAITFPQEPSQAGSELTNAVGLAVQTTPGQCYGAVFRTAVAGQQKSYFYSSWQTEDTCAVSQVCLNDLLALPTTQDSYAGLSFADNDCLDNLPSS